MLVGTLDLSIYKGVPKPLPTHVTCLDNVKIYYMIRLNNNLVYGVLAMFHVSKRHR